ncbi:MAG: hypothetical protein ACKVPX_09050 [Myxococcaceae bacterium]
MAEQHIDFARAQVVRPVPMLGNVVVYRFDRVDDSVPASSALGARVAGAIDWDSLDPATVSSRPLTITGDIYGFLLLLPSGGQWQAHFTKLPRKFSAAEGQPPEQLRFLRRFLEATSVVAGLEPKDRRAMVAALKRALGE